MDDTALLVYLDEGIRKLPVSAAGPDFSDWGEEAERYTLEWALDEVAPGEEGEAWQLSACLEAVREAGFYARPADGSYGILNQRELAMGLLPGVRASLPEEKGRPVRFPVGEENTWLHCWKFGEFATRPVLVVFHGHDETAADWAAYAADLQGIRVDLFVVEYRGYGDSEGGSARLGDMLDDLPAIHQAIGVPTDRMLVLGRGVGSLFALEFADRYPKIQGMILDSGVLDVHQLMADLVGDGGAGVSGNDLKAAVDSALNQKDKIARFRSPLLLFCAEDNPGNSLDNVEGFLAEAGSADKMAVFYETGANERVLDNHKEDFLSEMREFLRRTGPTEQECYISGFLGPLVEAKAKAKVNHKFARTRRPSSGRKSQSEDQDDS